MPRVQRFRRRLTTPGPEDSRPTAMKIRRALVSVSDKTGLVEFAKALVHLDVALLSTGGTYKALGGAGIPVETVESYTGSPEVMDGRVKTLHPKVHGGLLGREGTDDADLDRLGARYIDLVVEADLKPYDVGGLIPLVEEAGGVMTTWDGGRPEKGGTIIASGSAALHEAALELLNRT